MNGAASVHRFFVPNFCKCGHDATVHNAGTPVGTCRLCLGSTVNQNNHNFETSFDAPWPPRASGYLQTQLTGRVNSGGLGVRITKALAVAPIIGDPTVTLTDATGIVPGMSFQTQDTNFQRQRTTYTVTYVNGNVLTLNVPIIAAMLLTTPLIFGGTYGSGMGPARPCNGQRAG